MNLFNGNMFLDKLNENCQCFFVLLSDQLGKHLWNSLDLLASLVERFHFLNHFFAGVGDQAQEDLHMSNSLRFLIFILRLGLVNVWGTRVYLIGNDLCFVSCDFRLRVRGRGNIIHLFVYEHLQNIKNKIK